MATNVKVTQPRPAAIVAGAEPWGISLRFAAGVAIFAVTLAVYASTRSISLDDWDSVNFARAIEHFDIRLQQPHPPGYPAYVFIARLLNLLTNNYLTSLTLLSALCGALCVVAFYALCSDFGFGWAALPLAAMPLFWLNSEMALSDIPGLLFPVTAVCLLCRASRTRAVPAAWWQSRRFTLLAGCVLTGVGAGVRPQDAVVPFSVLAMFTLPRLIRRRDASLPADLMLGGVGLIAALLTWAVPFVRSFGGAQGIEPIREQLAYVRASDSLFGEPLTRELVAQRLADFGSIFGRYFGGPYDAGLTAFWLLAAALVVLALIAGRSRATALALSWLIPYWVVMLLVMQPGDPRKILPAVPPMFLLLGAAALRARPLLSVTGPVIGLALTGFLASRAAPLIRVLDTSLTPPEQAVASVASRFSPEDTLILAGSSLNHLYYEVPDYTALAWDFIDDDELQRQLSSGQYRHVIVLDAEGATLPDGFEPVDVRVYERDPRVLPKASRVMVTVFEQEAGVPSSNVAEGAPSVTSGSTT